MKLFIADDSKIVCDRLTEMLSEIKGVEIVGHAESAPEAIESIVRLKPDVVILDIRMPGGNGITVLEKIKQMPFSPWVIMLTNYPYPQYRKKCMDAGAHRFLDKSAEFEKIPEILRELAEDLSSGRPEEG